MNNLKPNFQIKQEARFCIVNKIWYLWKILLVYILINTAIFAILEPILGYDFIIIKRGIVKGFYNDQILISNLINIIVTLLLTPLVFTIYQAAVTNVRRTPLEKPVSTAFSNYKHLGKYMLVYFLTWLIISIGFALFIIPGFIFLVGLSFVPFITYDDPTLSVGQIIKKSWNMTKGHKGTLFLLNLSFIGWYILVPFTFGILGIWLFPYVITSNALFYQYVRQNYEFINNEKNRMNFNNNNSTNNQNSNTNNQNNSKNPDNIN